MSYFLTIALIPFYASYLLLLLASLLTIFSPIVIIATYYAAMSASNSDKNNIKHFKILKANEESTRHIA